MEEFTSSRSSSPPLSLLLHQPTTEYSTKKKDLYLGPIEQGTAHSGPMSEKVVQHKMLSILEQLQQNQETLRESVYALLGRTGSSGIPTPSTMDDCTCGLCGYQPSQYKDLQNSTNTKLQANTCTCTGTGICTCTCIMGPLDSTMDEAEEIEDFSVSDLTYSSDVDLIENMWDDFNITDYVPSPRYKKIKRNSPLPSSRKDFSPTRVTVPVPFSMTLREERKEKKKSRSLQMAEKEKEEREAEEEAHLAKQFKANPVPATTFLPLYEMINACNQERREQIKETSKETLKRLEKPFSFMAREEAKKKERESQILLLKETAEREKKEKQCFQAGEIPEYVFDPNIMERIEEEEEYRKIRIRQRALESLAESHLPAGMRIRGQEYNLERLLRRIAKDEKVLEKKKQPSANENKYAYNDFEQELMRRQRQVKTLTLPIEELQGKPLPIIRHSTPTKSVTFH
ncbi:PREDICTED: protein FAM161A-like [Amphimedon queenslandica]|uniref:FAM161 centrosomal protein A n=1 Tax=Amphimedon queenslandica TaxID=400682 RepID=A0A1X7VLQ4_AMPQE|nr:PREDICTED: protein FAM161A-like [Amphimedon queenslandica]|eukprot:XP_011409882.2 PREDICTED: protein FAM161A-like [Amphimedon queenslandica]